MSKGGPLGILLPILGGAAALTTGLGAAGIGPLSGLFSAGDAAAGAGADAALGAGTDAAAGVTAGALPAATDAITAGAGAAGAAAPGAFDAGSFLLPGTDTALAGAAPIAGGSVADAAFAGTGTDMFAGTGAGEIGALGNVGPAGPMGAVGDAGTLTPAAAAIPTAASLTGDALPATTAATMGAGQAAPFGADFSSSIGTSTAGTLATAAASPDTGGSLAGADFSSADASGAGGGSDAASGTQWWQRPSTWLAAAPLALMLGSRLFGGDQVPGSGPVQQAASTAATNEGILTGQGQQNMSYVNTGALPAGAQTAIDQAANAAKAQVASSFAQMGIPAGSTMEREQMAAVDQNAAVQRFNIQNQLLQSGISQFNTAGGFGSQVTQTDLALMNAQIQQEQELEAALANFAGAAAAGWNFSGGGGGATA